MTLSGSRDFLISLCLVKKIVRNEFCIIIKLIGPKVDHYCLVRECSLIPLWYSLRICHLAVILILYIPFCLSSISLFLSLFRSTLNLDLKVSKEPHGVHHEAAAGGYSSQHFRELYGRKQVLLIHSPPQHQHYFLYSLNLVFSFLLHSLQCRNTVYCPSIHYIHILYINRRKSDTSSCQEGSPEKWKVWHL